MPRSLGEIFRKVFPHPNAITPYLISYEPLPYGIAELSKGRFINEEVFGVTVEEGGQHIQEKSKCFHSLNEAITYISELQKD